MAWGGHVVGDIRIGRTLGPYAIEELLGSGGMATVYRGVHRSLGVQRAIKVMSSSLAANDSFVELFYREARLAAGLRHPNIVQMFDIAQHDGLHYLVMELLKGQSLHEVIQQNAPIPLTRAAHFVGKLADALDYAHQQGIAHRDVKPANAFVGPGDRLTLVDFGIARAADATHLTVTHGIGTPEYMAPEVFEEQLAEPGANPHRIAIGNDLYSLGVVAYVLVTGKVPFFGRTPNAVAYAQVNHRPPAPRSIRPDLPAAVEEVILRQLAKRPGERFSAARAFADAFAEAVHQASPGDAPPTRYGPAAVVPNGSAHDGEGRLSPPRRLDGPVAYPVTLPASATARPAPARSGRGWTALVVALSLLAAGLIGYATARETPVLSIVADMAGIGEARRTNNALSARAPAAAPTTAADEPAPADGYQRAAHPGADRRTDRRHAGDRAGGPHARPGRPWSSRSTTRWRRPSRCSRIRRILNPDLVIETLDKVHREMDPVSVEAADRRGGDDPGAPRRQPGAHQGGVHPQELERRPRLAADHRHDPPALRSGRPDPAERHHAPGAREPEPRAARPHEPLGRLRRGLPRRAERGADRGAHQDHGEEPGVTGPPRARPARSCSPPGSRGPRRPGRRGRPTWRAPRWTKRRRSIRSTRAPATSARPGSRSARRRLGPSRPRGAAPGPLRRMLARRRHRPRRRRSSGARHRQQGPSSSPRTATTWRSTPRTSATSPATATEPVVTIRQPNAPNAGMN